MLRVNRLGKEIDREVDFFYNFIQVQLKEIKFYIIANFKNEIMNIIVKCKLSI